MLKFLVWYVLGAIGLSLLDVVFLACYYSSKWPEDIFDKILEKSFEKAYRPLMELVYKGWPRILRITILIIMWPIPFTLMTIYALRGIAEYKESMRNAQN